MTAWEEHDRPHMDELMTQAKASSYEAAHGDVPGRVQVGLPG